MTQPFDIDRRAVLRLLGWWIGLAATPLQGFAQSQARRGTALSPTTGDPLGLLVHAQSAAAVGRAYLDANPEEADSKRLLERLKIPKSMLGRSVSDADLAAHRDRLRAAVRADFRAGRVRELSGWTLSVTELRLAALVALASNAEPPR